jgi:ABC-type transport system involved in multi-copper enzyme maturation permease subunit
VTSSSDRAAAKPATGVIYDLGYARYAGERKPPSTLWRVIMRQQLSHSWKTVWRYKLWLFAAIVAAVVCGAFMYVQRTETMEGFRRAGAPVQMLDGALVYAFRVYLFCGFAVTMTVASALVARDQETGAFTFYFARPVRARDYVLGKLAAIGIMMSSIFLAGPIALGGLRLALAKDMNDLRELVVWLPKICAVGGLATIAYTALPLAISSLAPRRTLALGIWAAYYIMFASAASALGGLTWAPLTAIDPSAAVMSLVTGLFDFSFLDDDRPAPIWAALVSVLGQSTVAIVVLYRRVNGQALGSVGGSS